MSSRRPSAGSPTLEITINRSILGSKQLGTRPAIMIVRARGKKRRNWRTATMEKKTEQKKEIKLVVKKVRTGVKAGNWCASQLA